MLICLLQVALTREIFKPVPELFDSWVGHYSILAVHEVSLVIRKLLVEGFCLPQAGVEFLVHPRDQHRLQKQHTGNGLLMTAEITNTTKTYFLNSGKKYEVWLKRDIARWITLKTKVVISICWKALICEFIINWVPNKHLQNYGAQ